MEIEVREIEEKDCEQITSLFIDVFKKPMGKEDKGSKHFFWEYINNPFGKVKVALAFDENKLIGANCLLPIKLNIMNKDVKATLSFDSMIHPDYQKKGLFTNLSIRLYNYVTNKNFFITYGFPNTNSYYVFNKKLNWKEIGKLPLLIKPLKTYTFINRKIKNNFISRTIACIFDFFLKINFSLLNIKNKDNIKEIDFFDDSFTELWRSVRNNFNITLIRD
ncbi:MAG: GNAT family N-acetyltransferase, partial [Deltaproteobacteria bacterium]|nr:GNAT family N-acetyltransferase [Deltaproteobacteria bacterium]